MPVFARVFGLDIDMKCVCQEVGQQLIFCLAELLGGNLYPCRIPMSIITNKTGEGDRIDNLLQIFLRNSFAFVGVKQLCNLGQFFCTSSMEPSPLAYLPVTLVKLCTPGNGTRQGVKPLAFQDQPFALFDGVVATQVGVCFPGRAR